ncbi:UNVERIFIED_CONTAM: hypothetical protein Cloal_2729 [Acetivibrio alkalicellulosi]
MFALISLIIPSFCAYHLLKKVFPYLFNFIEHKETWKKTINLPEWLITIPASFLVGNLFYTWLVYIFAYLFRNSKSPLLYSNIIVMTLFFILSAYFIVSFKHKYKKVKPNIKKNLLPLNRNFFNNNKLEIIYIVIWTFIWSFLMIRTLYITGNTLKISFSVYSDFGTHLSMIRSFSLGSNFPTQYSHFAGDPRILYHFMNQFFVGNLEFLGLRLDLAFNLTSILSILSFMMLLYAFAVILTDIKAVGILTSVFFFFRSSPAFIKFFNEISSLDQILNHAYFIGYTENENWGIYTQKVYLNQRHLPFALAIMMLIFIIVLPMFYDMIKAIKDRKDNNLNNQNEENNNLLYEFAFKKDSWLPENTLRYLLCGIILGLIGFWNGAVLLTILPILCIIAIFSKKRLEFLGIALISLALLYLQLIFFTGNEGTTVENIFYLGYLSPQKDLFSITLFMFKLLGIFPIVLLVSLFFAPKGGKILALAFFTPIIVAFTIQLTPDITVNHKYIVISVVLLNILLSNFIYKLFASKKIVLTIISSVLIIFLTLTGVIDLIAQYNSDKHYVSFKLDHPVLIWTKNETEPDSIFLSHSYVTHPIMLAGRKVFYGHSYFTWSAGYDVFDRSRVVNDIYQSTSSDKLKKLVQQHNIDYIVIEHENRTSDKYKLNEDIIKNTFNLVFEDSYYKISIYKTK